MSARDHTFQLGLQDRLYPASLRDLPAPPPVIYGRGDPEVLSLRSLSIIGSRRASPYGLAIAEMASRIATDSGLAVVSGGARGCDCAAGSACVGHGGRNIVVLGTGADVAYPSSSTSMIERTLDTGGAVISLEPWGTPPHRWAFPKRNKVIAALSDALIVSEAGMPSGTFTTAETAMDLGREVLVAPGSMFSPESRGCNYLISVGCCCLVDAESIEVALSRIYGTLRMRSPSTSTEADRGGHDRIVDILAASPMRVDELATALGVDGVHCLRRLGILENSGAIERLFDGRYALSKRSLHLRSGLGDNG